MDESPFKSPSKGFSATRKRVISGCSVSSNEPFSPLPSNLRFYTPTPRSNSESNENEAPLGTAGGSDPAHRVNPFERDILAGLQRNFWSPSIMDVGVTPPQKNWAIEHMSQLFPKDIESSPTTHQNPFPVDAQAEARAQADIDAYFSRGPIVPTPSPMKNKPSKNPLCFDLPVPHQSPLSSQESTFKKLKKSVSTGSSEKWTQTALSFPPVLPSYMEQMLMIYTVPSTVLSGDCEESSEALPSSQDSCDNDSGKSSSLNNSIRRRLELSFGEDPDSQEIPPASPIDDPFRRNHIVSTPPPQTTPTLNTTTSELEVQFMRCEFTPDNHGGSLQTLQCPSPAITPIHDEAADLRFNYQVSSTPRRKGPLLKRPSMDRGEGVIFRKRHSASLSSQYQDLASPPAKLVRSSSETVKWSSHDDSMNGS